MQTRATSFLVGLLGAGLLGALAISDPIDTDPGSTSAPSEMPDDAITPGVVASTDTAEVCGIVDGMSYSKRHRATPPELKHEIRARDHCDPKNSEVDHRCMLGIGCADVKENLWCQPGPGPGVTWNYHDKDKLELYLWQSVCKYKTMTLSAAQAVLLAPADWRQGYCRVFSDPRC